jgi:hypothetical protein
MGARNPEERFGVIDPLFTNEFGGLTVRIDPPVEILQKHTAGTIEFERFRHILTNNIWICLEQYPGVITHDAVRGLCRQI